MLKLSFIILVFFWGKTSYTQLSNQQKIEMLVSKFAPESHKAEFLQLIKLNTFEFNDSSLDIAKYFFEHPKGRQYPELFSTVISFQHYKIDMLKEVFKYAEDKDFPTLVKKIKDLDYVSENELKIWKLLLENPRAKNKMSLYRKFFPMDKTMAQAHKLILNLADERDIDRYFTVLAECKTAPNLKAMKEVLKTSPYNRNPEMLAMAIRLSPDAHQDFINHFSKIHAGQSWRELLQKKLVAALGQEFVDKNIKLPEYIVSLNQISAVETLIAERSLSPANIHSAIQLGEQSSSYQSFQAIIKKTVPGNFRDNYLQSFFNWNSNRIRDQILKTDHLFYQPSMIRKINDLYEDPHVVQKQIEGIENFLNTLKKEKIPKYEIEQIVDQILALPKDKLLHHLDFANNAIRKKKGPITAPLINRALKISPDHPLHQKAFLLGQEYLSAGAQEDLTQYLTSPKGIVSEEGLASFHKILKEGQINDLNISDCLSGTYIHREQARKLIHKYAHPEDLKWALEYLEKNSAIDRPQGLGILKEILANTSIQREKRLIELAISQKYNNTPLSLFKKAIETLSQNDLEFFMKEHMVNEFLISKDNTELVTLLLNDPFTATWEPFLKECFNHRAHSGVIKKEQEVIQLARKKFSSSELKALENKLRENFSTRNDIGSEENRLDSIQTLLHHSPYQNPNPMLQDLLNQGALSDLQLKSFKEMLKLSHPDDSFKLLQILRKNKMTDLKARVFLKLLSEKKSERNLILINAILSLDLRDDKKTIDAIFLIAEKAPAEMAADLVFHLNGVVLNEEQLAAIKNGLKNWPPADLKQFFLHTLDKKLPAPSIKFLAQEVSASTILSHNEMKEVLKSWSLNETQLKAKTEEAVILARNEVDFRRWLLDQVLDRDPEKKWRFTKTNDLLRQRSAAILLKTYEGTDEVSPLMKELEKVAESSWGQSYRHKPHFRFEEENPLVRRALQHFAGGDLAPTSSCDQIRQIIADGKIQLEGTISP